MRSHRVEFVVYLVGLLPLGLFQHQFRIAINYDGLAFGAVVAYLLLLRGLGRTLSQRFAKDRRRES